MQERFRDREDIADRMVPLQLGLAMEYAALDFWEKLEKERSRADPVRVDPASSRRAEPAGRAGAPFHAHPLTPPLRAL